MNCSVCDNPLSAKRMVFRCECGATTDAQCWGKHIFESHEPSFTAGRLTFANEFEPDEPAKEEGEPSD